VPTIVKTSGFSAPSEAEQGRILIGLPDQQVMWFAMARGMTRKLVERAEQAGLEAYLLVDMARKLAQAEIVNPSTGKDEAIISVAFDDKPQGFSVFDGSGKYLGDENSIDQALAIAKPGISLPPQRPQDAEA